VQAQRPVVIGERLVAEGQHPLRPKAGCERGSPQPVRGVDRFVLTPSVEAEHRGAVDARVREANASLSP